MHSQTQRLGLKHVEGLNSLQVSGNHYYVTRFSSLLHVICQSHAVLDYAQIGYLPKLQW